MNILKKIVNKEKVIPFTSSQSIVKGGQGFTYKGEEYIHYSPLSHSESAFRRFSNVQISIFIGFTILLTASFLLNWHLTLILLMCFITILYFADLLFNMFLIIRSFIKPMEISISDEEILTKNDWPKYTILCPLYKEWEIVPQFINAMSQLEYPKDKLQVMILLEEDDATSIKNITKLELPKYFDIIVVPHSKPKTKPKACNYGLKFATGEYVVIFDAEDIPDQKQLKKAVIAFENSDPKVRCIQAKLNFYNPHQNLLSRFFSAEYSLWFDLILTGLHSINAPIPLGGTSNHFRKSELINMKGWDSFNVTEDCDLGMRLVKQGYRTAIINSITLEEANTEVRNWFAQRTRWIKGYIQTYFIHMRKPQDFTSSIKHPHFIIFQLVVGGKILTTLVNLILWSMTIIYFGFNSYVVNFIDSLFLTPVFYLGTISLFLGNFLYLYYYMVGSAKHGHHQLVKYSLLVPLYWLAISIAAWVSLYKFIKAPHYWSKTKHGLHLNKIDSTKNIKKFTIQQAVLNLGKMTS